MGLAEAKKSYYAIIPANVRYDKQLTPNAKLLYGEITALANEKGYCWASNSYFAELYGVSVRSVSKWINQLNQKKYIHVKIIYNENNKEIKERRIYITHPLEEKFYTYGRNVLYPIEEKFQDNNTINNTLYKDIVEYLNKRAGTNYKHTTRKTRALIKARINEGFTIDDFKKVIDIKTAEWKNDPKMSKYIRPETLFSNKFEGYLNQITVNNKGQSADKPKPFQFD